MYAEVHVSLNVQSLNYSLFSRSSMNLAPLSHRSVWSVVNVYGALLRSAHGFHRKEQLNQAASVSDENITLTLFFESW